MFDEGPSGGQDMGIIDADASSPNSELKEIIREQRVENESLHKKLQMAKWVINYLEKRNKQLEDEHELYE